MDKFLAWLKQPSTIHGLGVVAGAVSAGAIAYATGNHDAAAAVGVAAYAGVHLAVPDSTAVPAAAQALSEDAVRAIATDQVKADVPKLVSEGIGLALAAGLAGVPLPGVARPG